MPSRSLAMRVARPAASRSRTISLGFGPLTLAAASAASSTAECMVGSLPERREVSAGAEFDRAPLALQDSTQLNMRDANRLKEKYDLSLDSRQIVSLVIAGLVVLG